MVNSLTNLGAGVPNFDLRRVYDEAFAHFRFRQRYVGCQAFRRRSGGKGWCFVLKILFAALSNGDIVGFCVDNGR